MIDRTADWHTHSDLTDGADPWETMAAAAGEAGLALLGASDHVRRDSTWVPEYAARVRGLDGLGGLRVSCGVEVKMLDSTGRLDLPEDLPALDFVLVADHQFPGPDGPVHPRAIAEQVATSPTAAAAAVDTIVAATCAAVGRSPAPAIVAHLFSLLPKCGLDAELVTDEHVDSLAAAVVAAGAAVEVNEKWRCPGLPVLRRLAHRGVRLTAGSDAHRAADVGRWVYLDEVESGLAAAPS
jgi:putative hydrolase